MGNITQQAIEKIAAGKAEYKADRYGQIMQDYVQERLADACNQSEEFAQAVLDGGTFAECMAAVCQKIGNSISDLEVARRAANFYFPGCQIDFQMVIRMSKYEEPAETEERAGCAGIILSLEDWLS